MSAIGGTGQEKLSSGKKWDNDGKLLQMMRCMAALMNNLETVVRGVEYKLKELDLAVAGVKRKFRCFFYAMNNHLYKKCCYKCPCIKCGRDNHQINNCTWADFKCWIWGLEGQASQLYEVSDQEFRLKLRTEYGYKHFTWDQVLVKNKNYRRSKFRKWSFSWKSSRRSGNREEKDWGNPWENNYQPRGKEVRRLKGRSGKGSRI